MTCVFRGTEDKKLLRIVLSKSNRDAANCWRSLLEGQYAADAYVFDQMERKLTLERFQNEVRTVEPKTRTLELEVHNFELEVHNFVPEVRTFELEVHTLEP